MADMTKIHNFKFPHIQSSEFQPFLARSLFQFCVYFYQVEYISNCDYPVIVLIYINMLQFDIMH